MLRHQRILICRLAHWCRWEGDRINSLILDWEWLSTHAALPPNLWQDNLGDILAAAQVIREKTKDGEALGSAFEHVLKLHSRDGK